MAGLDEGRDLAGTALHNATLNGQGSSRALFDHLHQVQFRPGAQLGSPALPVARQLRAKSPVEGPDITGQAIDRHQQGPTQGNRPHPPHQGLNQGFVSPSANLAPQPQPGRNHHRHSHPDDPALELGFDFIRLHLAQVQLALTDDPFVNFLTMRAGFLPPILHRPLVKAKGRHHRLYRTAIGQQGQDQHHRRRLCFQPIEQAPFRRRKGLVAHFAAIPLLFLAMDPDIPFSNLSSCRTVKIGAKYGLWVHYFGSWVWCRNRPVCLMNPFFSNFVSFLA